MVTAASLLAAILDPTIDGEAAKRLLSLRVSDAVQPRIDRLADKCNEGLLTEEERAE